MAIGCMTTVMQLGHANNFVGFLHLPPFWPFHGVVTAAAR
jgi:hypothetical protein